jgi:hypothetical protein
MRGLAVGVVYRVCASAVVAAALSIVRTADAEMRYSDEPYVEQFALADGSWLSVAMPKRVFRRADYNFSDAGRPTIRQGTGAAWSLIGSPKLPGTGATFYVEILPKQAAKEYAAAYGEILPSLAAKVGVDTRAVAAPLEAKVSLGGKQVVAHRISYEVRYTYSSQSGDRWFQAVTAVFTVGRSLVVATSEGSTLDMDSRVDVLLGALSVSKNLRPVTAFKTLDIARGVYRYVVGAVPAGWTPAHVPDAVLSWEKRDKAGRTMATIVLAARNGGTVEAVLGDAPGTSLEVAGRPATRVDVDRTTTVALAFGDDQVWWLRLETKVEAPDAEATAAARALGTMLESLYLWRTDE